MKSYILFTMDIKGILRQTTLNKIIVLRNVKLVQLHVLLCPFGDCWILGLKDRIVLTTDYVSVELYFTTSVWSYILIRHCGVIF